MTNENLEHVNVVLILGALLLQNFPSFSADKDPNCLCQLLKKPNKCIVCIYKTGSKMCSQRSFFLLLFLQM